MFFERRKKEGGGLGEEGGGFVLWGLGRGRGEEGGRGEEDKKKEKRRRLWSKPSLLPPCTCAFSVYVWVWVAGENMWHGKNAYMGREGEFLGAEIRQAGRMSGPVPFFGGVFFLWRVIGGVIENEETRPGGDGGGVRRKGEDISVVCLFFFGE